MIYLQKVKTIFWNFLCIYFKMKNSKIVENTTLHDTNSHFNLKNSKIVENATLHDTNCHFNLKNIKIVENATLHDDDSFQIEKK